MTENLAFALTAGTLAALNPCGFAMLPAYLTLFVTGGPNADAEPTRLAALRRALGATAAMTVGFLTVFGMFGLLLAPVASTVQRWLPAATVLVGAGLVLLGAFMLAGREILVRTPKMRLGRPSDRSPVDGALRHLLRHRVPGLHHRPVPGSYRHHLPRW